MGKTRSAMSTEKVDQGEGRRTMISSAKVRNTAASRTASRLSNRRVGRRDTIEAIRGPIRRVDGHRSSESSEGQWSTSSNCGAEFQQDTDEKRKRQVRTSSGSLCMTWSVLIFDSDPRVLTTPGAFGQKSTWLNRRAERRGEAATASRSLLPFSWVISVDFRKRTYGEEG